MKHTLSLTDHTISCNTHPHTVLCTHTPTHQCLTPSMCICCLFGMHTGDPLVPHPIWICVLWCCAAFSMYSSTCCKFPSWYTPIHTPTHHDLHKRRVHVAKERQCLCKQDTRGRIARAWTHEQTAGHLCEGRCTHLGHCHHQPKMSLNQTLARIAMPYTS